LTMEAPALIADLNRVYEMELSDRLRLDQVETLLAEKITTMINGDFSALVQLLYRVDVDESRLRKLLRENKASDAGGLIARLILERLWQKILTRRAYNNRSGPPENNRSGPPGDSRSEASGEEERW
jgi:hypothetical protein